MLFKEIKKNANKYSDNIIITPKKFYCDFENGISNAKGKKNNSKYKY
jgi:predicted secreted acid phosphatase